MAPLSSPFGASVTTSTGFGPVAAMTCARRELLALPMNTISSSARSSVAAIARTSTGRPSMRRPGKKRASCAATTSSPSTAIRRGRSRAGVGHVT
jgi:hypothetical protein